MTIKEQLKQQIKTIPPSVMNGGVMTAVLWKEKIAKAQALLSKPRANDWDLETMLSELRSFK